MEKIMSNSSFWISISCCFSNLDFEHPVELERLTEDRMYRDGEVYIRRHYNSELGNLYEAKWRVRDGYGRCIEPLYSGVSSSIKQSIIDLISTTAKVIIIKGLESEVRNG